MCLEPQKWCTTKDAITTGLSLEPQWGENYRHSYGKTKLQRIQIKQGRITKLLALNCYL